MTGACSLQFIGNATTVLRLGPFTVLTDPNFLHQGQRAYLGHGLSSVRRTEPALQIAELPALTAIVLSHMHGDHWDRNARRGLDRSLPVLTTPKAARALHRQGFRAALGLSTWSSQTLTEAGHTLTVTAMPGHHATGIARHLLPPVMGSMLEYRATSERVELRLYITGDTLLVEDLKEIPQRYSAPDVTVLHLGGTTLPGGIMVSMDAVQGADLVELIRAPRNIPVHHDDYGVFTSPLSAFRTEMHRRGLDDRMVHVDPGQTVSLLP